MKYKIMQEFNTTTCGNVWYAYNDNNEMVAISSTSADECEQRLRDAVSAPEPVLVKEVEL